MTPVLNPNFFISDFLKYLALSINLSTNVVDDLEQSPPAMQAATSGAVDRRGEQERATALAQPFDDDFVSGHQSADHTRKAC